MRRRVHPAPRDGRKTGARLPNLSAVLSDAKTVWQRVTMPQWYGEGERCIELTV
jgi:hypothetical protein